MVTIERGVGRFVAKVVLSAAGDDDSARPALAQGRDQVPAEEAAAPRNEDYLFTPIPHARAFAYRTSTSITLVWV